MKFRYKVLIINIILLSISIGIIGYLMIDKNFQLALESQIKNAIEENNLIQSAVEYRLLDVVNSNIAQTEFQIQLEDIGSEVTASMSANQSDIFILYDENVIFTNSDAEQPYPAKLIEEAEIGKKNYIILDEDASKYIYVSSCNNVADKKLNIVNKHDITDVYNLMHQQESYFNLLLIIVLAVCSIAMFIISHLLTRPLETLNRVSASFGAGDYSARVNITTHDEVGELADTYNAMAQAVSDHVNELNDMIVRQDQFVADFTHEIKTPMTSIIGYADTLRSKEMSRENQIMAASYIFNEGKRLEAMSMKLFDFIYTKQHNIAAKPFMTGKLMSDVESSVTPSLAAKNISLKMQIENCLIDGDIDLLKSSFINIIDNARKASQENSKIIFSGIRDGNNFTIRVQDFGTGINEEHLSRICDEFYMIDKSRSRSEGGAGLGLSLAALVFKCHNADFHIDSTLGEGTTMQITFQNAVDITREEDVDDEEV